MPSAVSIVVSLRASTTSGLIGVQRALHGLQEDASASDRALGNLRSGLMGLAPAAVPVAASLVAALAPIAAQMGAATVAVGVFAAAMIPQFKAVSDAAKAHDKYAAAVAKSGAGSKAAAQAETEYLATLQGMPPATRKAAAALGDLQDQYTAWSNSLAGDTMPVAIKSFGILEAIFPRLTPMVKGTSDQLDRLMNVLGGAMEAPQLDKLSGEFNRFAVGSLKKAVDGVIHFSRVVSSGDYDHGPLHEFMDYAKRNGPMVQDTLKHLVEALAHIGEAASNAGPGMLAVVNALAGLASAIPTPVLTRMLQLYTAMRLIKTASAGMLAATSAIGRLDRALASMGRAGIAAGGGLAGVRAALATLSTGAKVGIAITAIAALVIVLKKLGDSKEAPPNVDKLTTSLGNLGRTGKDTGELLRVFGNDLSDLNKNIEHSSDPFKSTENISALDKALAGMVQGGKADIAAAAVAKLSAQYEKGGKPAENLTKQLENYRSALADAKFESDLAADSMGLFGRQAQDTQKTLDSQKQSADGLRQAIQALNDVNRAGIDAQIGFEQSIADGNKALKDNGQALKMVNGQLVLTSQKARDEASALDDLADKTDAAGAAARDQGKSWATVYGIYDRGRTQLIKLATSMGLTKDQAKALANQILKTPDKTASLKGDLSDLQAKLAKARAALKSAPSSKTTALKATIADLLKQIAAAKAAIASVHGKTVNITTTHTSTGTVSHEGGGYAHGGVIGAAGGGPRSGRTLVGEAGPELVDLAAGSRVRTAGATRQILAAGGGAGQPTVIVLKIGEREFGRVWLDTGRQQVRAVGGLAAAFPK
jgi:hypothetical protein